MDADGQNTVKASRNDDLWLGSPAWSHDGKRLAYVGMRRNRQGGGRIYVEALGEASEPQDLGPGEAPCWSPDGKRIVFWFHQGGQERLHVLEFDSGAPPQLLPGQVTKRNSDPAWSPDGKQIAFASDRP
ncbi:MAG TPA: hypothetical protein VHB99_07650 [Pirellulales bacterium]|nr:hypothetical protein [Pirellulales bacterium]